jgi:cyanophycinase-like exopeptidase
MCVGGGTDPVEATKWFLRKANKGDVIFFIPSPLNFPEPQSYFKYVEEWCEYDDGQINSIRAIVVNSQEIAYSSEVLELVANAEGIYFEGGDQKNYWNFINNSPLQNLLDNLIQTKKIVVGKLFI